MDRHVLDATAVRAAPLDAQIERLLACPRCRSPLSVQATEIECTSPTCGFGGLVAQDVAVMDDRSKISFFDDKHEVMQRGNEGEGVRCLCYDRQEELLAGYFRPGSVIVDVGCGPALPYQRTPDPFIIGVEPSFDSIRANTGVDLRVYGTALALPLPDRSVDTVVCLYSIHHMVGATRRANLSLVQGALREFGRVVKPGGEVLVFEIEPWAPFWLAEKMAWNSARNVLGRKLDMHFWSADVLDRLMHAVWPHARLRRQNFNAPWLSTFPPVFSMPWLKWPRFLYPFSPVLLDWQL
ncbi:MAG: class I SAM-dependent methyltransferase [Chloroflexi bacterium]|nr:class I SAM-dependent methyltransferase [Chloroflexota bacterium]MBV9599203.1 class I SAM-dependent methyltransferase [Chloroflexota bacterium]